MSKPDFNRKRRSRLQYRAARKRYGRKIARENRFKSGLERARAALSPLTATQRVQVRGLWRVADGDHHLFEAALVEQGFEVFKAKDRHNPGANKAEHRVARQRGMQMAEWFIIRRRPGMENFTLDSPRPGRERPLPPSSQS